MASLSGAQIQSNLVKFARSWEKYRGTERAEAQTFLNELFVAYGQDRREAGARFEDPQTEGGILDLLYPGVAIIEMKAPAQASRLDHHREQALRYWHHSDDPAEGRPAPPYVVLCAFQRFEVWEPGRFPSGPRDSFDLDELADRYEALLFLAGQHPLFLAHRRHLTQDAAERVAALNVSLSDRHAADPSVIRRFLLQTVWCLFAEGLGLLPHEPFSQILMALRADPSRSSAAELGYLFTILNLTADQKGSGGGLYAEAPYVNGGLFEEPARVHLQPAELEILAEVAAFEWRDVDPTIFGALMEDCLGRERRWELGAHYTYEADIMRIVRPSIIDPWTERIASSQSIAATIEALQNLCGLRVLDPACGCGNFLYVAYREIRSLEQTAKQQINDLAASAGVAPPKDLPSFPISNIQGIEIDEFAVMIARLTLWMGHKLVTDQFGLVEPVLPLVDLSGIKVGDSLVLKWPDVEVIIGNPPFHGAQQLRSALGDDYINWLKSTFGCGVKDLCVYWFRKAADRLPPGGRAGLVGTNSISQNRAREASLDYVVAHGGVITSAISTEVWPGDANVHVSIVNWVKDPQVSPSEYVLDDRRVSGITTSLREGDGSPSPEALPANAGRAFQGPIPVGEGFVLTPDEARDVLADGRAPYERVIRPYLIGDDIANEPHQRPSRWIIDFSSMPLEEAQKFPRALAIVEERVKPERLRNKDARFKRDWWLFGRPRGEMRDALGGLSRYLGGTATGKRLLFCWCDRSWCPSNASNVFAFEDDFAFGLLSSAAHLAWAWRWSSTMKSDLRYTPTTVFATFPWPYAVEDSKREEVSELAAELVSVRTKLCAATGVGLTRLYNTMDAGGHRDLANLHFRLDRAVVACYGWPSKIAQDPAELVAHLALRNAEITAGTEYVPFAPLPEPDLDVPAELPFHDLG
jgi:hypothetical protein